MSVPTHHHMQKLHPCRYALALLLTLGLGASLRAQAVTPSGASTEQQAQAAAETPVVLNAFTVDTSTDVGYVAVNSLAGGRNNTPLAITPTTVSALTAEFIDDLQLTNATDALKWTMNAIPQNLTPNVGSGNEFNSWAVNLRGAGAGPQGGTAPTVNYFPIYAIKDFFNVDRFELDLGPNSILFGVGSLGGTVSATWGAAPTGGTANTQSMAEWGGPSSFQLWIPALGSFGNWGAGYAGTGLAAGPFYTNAVLRPNSYSLQNPGYWPAGTGTETMPALPSRDFTVGPTDRKSTRLNSSH